jgi:hypothetical protein
VAFSDLRRLLVEADGGATCVELSHQIKTAFWNQ